MKNERVEKDHNHVLWHPHTTQYTCTHSSPAALKTADEHRNSTSSEADRERRRRRRKRRMKDERK